MIACTDKRKDKRTDERMVKCTDERTEGQTDIIFKINVVTLCNNTFQVLLPSSSSSFTSWYE